MGYKAAMQVLKKAESLKNKLTRQSDLLNDLQAWTDQQQLQTIYHQVLVLDLEYALDKKVEQELWTLGFKNHISILQEQARDKKNARRSDSQALLSWCLEAASGFYLTLLQELCSTYDLDLPFRKSTAIFGKLKTTSYIEPTTLPQSSSCLYICQYCLVHLGDIARYRNQRKQAESFYKHAILVSPNSGHPYNQLALLEASQGNKLSTVFHYVRGIALKNPFPVAATNLSNIFSSILDKDEAMLEYQTKLSVNEFISVFLRAHALLHTNHDLVQAQVGVKCITAALTALVATQSFTTDKLIQMTVINMYALKHTTGDDIIKVKELTEDENKIRELILDLIAGSLSAFLLPVYTLKMDETLLDYYALPAIQLISLWIRKEPKVLLNPVFTNRLQIWPGYCKLLNAIQNYMKKDDYTKYSKVALTYDRELQGFLPLQAVFNKYDFKQQAPDALLEKNIRAHRFIEFGKWLSTYDVGGTKLIISTENDDKSVLQFEPGCIQPDPTNQLLEEMKSFKVVDTEHKLKGPEKKGGILKPQGSLEKSREERVVKINGNEEGKPMNHNLDSTKFKRITQNVALQSIYKKIEESKQVKFSAETNDKEKQKLKTTLQQQQLQRPLLNSQPPPPQQQASGPTNPPPPPYRTQAFNQNHPALNNLAIDKSDFFNLNFSNPANHFMPHNDFKLPFNMQTNNLFSNPPPSSNNYSQLTDKPPPPPIAFNLQQPQQQYNFKEDPRPLNNWWPNTNFQQQHQPPPQPGHDYYRFSNQQAQPFPSSNPPNDLFNLPPWTNMPRSTSNPNVGYTNQNISMRQAMLNENKHLGGASSSNSTSNLVNNAPGYSLFNTTSWAPPIPGQLRNSATNDHLRQQSMFMEPPPQSLQQLLEQQNQLQKGDT